MRTIAIEHQGGSVFRVVVNEDGSRTSHEVTVRPSDVEHYASGSTPEELLEASFAFLLEREPKESILRRFDLPQIEQYFPEYPRVMRAGRRSS
jgi:hypothetical protein